MTTTRRTFLSAVAANSAATCLGPLTGCATPLTGTHLAGNIADLPEGGTLAVEGQPLVLQHRDFDRSEFRRVAA